MTKDLQYPTEVKMAAIKRVVGQECERAPTRIYLASPYSARDKAGLPDEYAMHGRFLKACSMAGRIMQEGYIVFCPIAHSVPIADSMDNHLEQDFWMRQDYPLIDWADELWVLMLPGWEDSCGIKLEIAYAEKLRKPVYYLSENAYQDLDKVKEA